MDLFGSIYLIEPYLLLPSQTSKLKPSVSDAEPARDGCAAKQIVQAESATSRSRTRKADPNSPMGDSSRSTGPTALPALVKLEISILQPQNKAENQVKSQFSFLLFALLVLRFETRSLMTQFYGLESKALKSLIPALNESRFSLAQKKPSA